MISHHPRFRATASNAKYKVGALLWALPSLNSILYWEFSHRSSDHKSCTLELSINSLKEGPNHEFEPSLRKLYVKSSSGHCVLELVFESRVKFFGPPLSTSQTLREILRSKIGYVHGTCCPKTHISLYNASLGTHPNKTS